MNLKPVFVILFVFLSTILLVELPKRQKSPPEIVELDYDYGTPECLHVECFRDTSYNEENIYELSAIRFSNH